MEDSNRSANPSIHEVSDPARRVFLLGGISALAVGALSPWLTARAFAAGRGPLLGFELHMPVLDGAYMFSANRPTFHQARQPGGEELNDLLDTLSRRIVRLLERHGLLVADPVAPYLDLAPGSSLDQLQAASIAYRIAIGPMPGAKHALIGTPARLLALRANRHTGFAGAYPVQRATVG